jgi:hypothetical protein
MAIVAWPPPVPVNTRTNATPLLDAHAADHNKMADALDTLVARATPLAHVEVTAPVTVTGFNLAGSVLVATAPTITYDGGPIIVEFSAPWAISQAQINQTMNIGLADGTTTWTDQGLLAAILNPGTTGSLSCPIFGRRRFTPSAGAHTFHVRAWYSASGNAGGSIMGSTGLNGQPVPMILRILRA